MKGNSRQLMLKNLNRRLVLQYMRLNDRVTKSRVAAVTGLTFMAIQKIMAGLLELSLVQADQYETGTGMGRKVQTYTINESYGRVVGIHINRCATRAAVMDLKGNILSQARHAMGPELNSQNAFMAMLRAITEKVIAEAPAAKTRMFGIGIGVPGPLNPDDGVILSPPNFPALAYLPLADIMKEHFGYPVLLQKDTNAIALGEFWNGAGKGCSHMVYVDLDIGIGSGLIINGEIYAGAHQLAGEFGHITLEPHGSLCACGNRGCLEALASGAALLREFSSQLEKDARHPLFACGNSLTIQDILAAAEKNDMLALSIVNQAAFYTGIAIHNLIHTIDPQIIVLGGILIENYSRYLKTIESIANERRLKGTKDVRIVPSVLSSQAGVIGAGCIVADHFFNEMVNSVLSKEG